MHMHMCMHSTLKRACNFDNVTHLNSSPNNSDFDKTCYGLWIGIKHAPKNILSVISANMAWLEVCKETPCPWSHTWRMLKVPDWSLWEWGHLWYHGSSLHVILYLCAKFKLSSMIRSVSRIPCPWSPYLEDIIFVCQKKT